MRSNQSGLGLLEMIIAISVMTLAAVVYYSQVYLVGVLNSNQFLYHKNVTNYIHSIRTLVSSPVAFMKSAQSTTNPGFWACLNSAQTACTNGNLNNFNLIADNGDDTHLWLDNTMGLTVDMVPCTGYDPVSPTTPGCVFQYSLRWQAAGSPTCPTGPNALGTCFAPSMSLQGQLNVSKAFGNTPLNTSNFLLVIKIR